MSGMVDNAMPFFIQLLRNLNSKVEKLMADKQERREAAEGAQHLEVAEQDLGERAELAGTTRQLRHQRAERASPWR